MKTCRLRGILTACLSCLCLLAIWLLPVRAVELPEPTADFYVNDYAGIFTEQQRTELPETARALDRETTAQLVVLTVKTTSVGSRKKRKGNLPFFAPLKELRRGMGAGDAQKSKMPLPRFLANYILTNPSARGIIVNCLTILEMLLEMRKGNHSCFFGF